MTAQIIHHLWQSTLCAGVAWALAATLRRYSARLRYLVWLVASLKFVVPFSALMALGLALRPSVWHGVSFIQAGFLDSAALFVQPTFSASITQPVLLGTSLGVLITLVWGVGSAVVFTSWILRWLRIRSIVSAALPYSLNVPIDVRVSAAVGAPCVFGIFEPVLLLPYKVISRMSAAELSAVCEHELCHVRRCDNMMAALHMLVTGIFWFHPVVWWIGRHLLEERERACDEHVIEAGTIPRVYAEGILKACHVSIESRLELAASASGGHLQKRIEAIVRFRPARQLGLLGRAGLLFMGCAVFVVPVSAGVAASRVLATPRLPIDLMHFDRVTIAQSRVHPETQPRLLVRAGSLSMRNTTLRELVGVAYGTTAIFGGPVWLDARFDIEAHSTSPLEEGMAGSAVQRQMILSLLVERFDLRFVEHRSAGM